MRSAKFNRTLKIADAPDAPACYPKREGGQDGMKKVCCLYRVSTIGQVEKNDIPMQKTACHTFAEMQGWTITEEHSEKGISGYRVSADDRDAIQDIKRSALAGKFDILLVFMFDRIGRREDETPFSRWNRKAVWNASRP